MQIRGLIVVDDQARFRSDVQLSLFEDAKENLALLNSFIFTVAAPGNTAVNAAQQVSSVDLLNHLVDAFSSSIAKNRIVTIANYGHGKSHLALALTNYFSKPVGSEEVSVVFEKLEHAVNEPAKVSRLHDFKNERGEFLVVRLRGDTPSSLREQFIPSLERALSEHPTTTGIRPPLWHDYAEKILSSLSDDELYRANAVLSGDHMDIPTLVAQVRQRKDVRDLCIKALTAAKSMVPDLGAQLSLGEMLEWVADNLCGQGKPLAGILVLFDEFSLYVSRYAQRGAVGELQDLLNGISNRPTKAVFLAFAQHDPITVANNAAISQHGRDTLRHELSRIDRKLALYSLMESVIDAYLRQRPSAWLEFAEDWEVKDALDRATHIAYESFLPRYMTTLQWTQSRFEEVVTRGCFPLHPLTTALLCNIEFNAGFGGDPRTVLGFVLDNLAAKLSENAAVDGGINWVYPIALVDYFGESISPELYRLYQNARRALDNKDDREKQILMAMLLQEAAELTLSQSGQVSFVAESTGLDNKTVESSLRSMSEGTVIRFDPIKKTYSFWPLTTDPGKLDRLVRTKLEKVTLGLDELSKLNSRLGREFQYGNIPMNVTWGHAEDWSAQQILLTPQHLKANLIRTLSQSFGVTSQGIEDGSRGLVIWLLARNEEEVQWCRSNADLVLTEADQGDQTPPILLIVPKEPSLDLIEAFRRNFVLEALSTNDRSDVGLDLYEHEVEQNRESVKQELKRLIGDPRFYTDQPRDPSTLFMPSTFRAAVLASSKFSVRTALTTMYELAYRHGPKEFNTTYRLTSSTKFRDAVKLVAGMLLSGQTSTIPASLSTNSMARDLCNNFLVQKWGLLTPEYLLRPPTNGRLQHAWNYLNETFTPGSKEQALFEPLIQLLRPPYGYDYNTLTLLFTAWFGYYNQDLDLIHNGRASRHSTLSDALQRSAKDLIQSLKWNHIALSRRNPDDARLQVRAIIERRTDNPWDEAEAEAALGRLESFYGDTRNNAREREEAKTKAEALDQALTVAKDYREQANKIHQQITSSESYNVLLSALVRLKQLPRVTLVSTHAPEPAQLQKDIKERLQIVIDAECKKYERPNHLKQVDLYRGHLTAMSENVKRSEVPHLDTRIQSALEMLKQTEKAIEARQSESGVRTELTDIDLSASYTTLTDKAKRLYAMSGYSSEVMALRDQKLQLLRQEIADMEKRIERLQTEIDSVDSSQKVQALRDNLLISQRRYEDSPFQQQFDNALKRLSRLREFFPELEQVLRRTIQTPADGDSLVQKVASVRAQFQDVMSPMHSTLLEQVERSVHERLSAKQREAMSWLRTCEEEVYKESDINRLIDKLGRPPAFLPEDATVKLDNLYNVVQTRIDNDAVLQVENAFRKIGDRKRQQECLERLSKIIAEENTGVWSFLRRKA